MAEIVGVVSGLTSLSIQLLETAVKLRQVYKSYKDAPDFLQRITDEIELFGLLLQQLERDRQAHDVSDDGQAELLGRSIQLCQSSVASIKATTEKLELAIGRSKWVGKLRSVFEEKEVRELCAELERAKTSLGLAHQLYTESRRRQDDERSRLLSTQNRALIEQQSLMMTAQLEALHRVSQDVTSLPQKVVVGVSSSQRCCNEPQSGMSMPEDLLRSIPKTIIRNRTKKKMWKASRTFRLGPWFTSRIWEIHLGQAISGWDIRLRTINIVSREAPIFRLCENGDFQGVQKLFADGEASPFDEDEGGRCVFFWAIFHGHPDLCRLLLQYRHPPAMWCRVSESRKTTSNLVYTLLFDSGTVDADLLVESVEAGDETPWWWQCCWTLDQVTTILSSMSIEFEKLSLEHRFEIASALIDSKAEICWYLLKDFGSNDLARYRAISGSTVLHLLASCPDLFEYPPTTKMFGDLLRARTNPHSVDDRGCTPLMNRIDRSVKRSGVGLVFEYLRIWVENMIDAGVDLAEYSRNEVPQWKKQDRWLFWDRTQGFYVVEPMFDLDISGCDLLVRKTRRVYYYKTLEPSPNLPGVWPSIPEVPGTLPWKPTEEDFSTLPEGTETDHYWDQESRVGLRSERTYSLRHLLDMRQQQEEGDSLRPELLLHTTQDDCGSVWLGLHKHTRSAPQRRRSSSQPPDIRDSAVNARGHCYPVHKRWSYYRPWLYGYHYCRVDSRWRFGGEEIWTDVPWPGKNTFIINHRRCMKRQCVVDEEKT